MANRDELEIEIHKKMEKGKYFKKKKEEDEDDYTKPIIRRVALIDNTKFNNMHIKSMADKKRAWKGIEGRYRQKDLASWYKLYDDTMLLKIKKDIRKDFFS
jgi:hypothetical protein